MVVGASWTRRALDNQSPESSGREDYGLRGERLLHGWSILLRAVILAVLIT